MSENNCDKSNRVLRVATACTQDMREKCHQTVATPKNKTDATNVTKQLRRQNKTDATNVLKQLRRHYKTDATNVAKHMDVKINHRTDARKDAKHIGRENRPQNKRAIKVAKLHAVVPGRATDKETRGDRKKTRGDRKETQGDRNKTQGDRKETRR